MKKNNLTLYAIRALKHLFKLLLLMVVIYLALLATGTLGITTDELFGYKGAILLTALVAISLLYPKHSFVSNSAKASLSRDRETILKACRMSGLELDYENEKEMFFRASKPLKRLINLGDDAIRIYASSSESVTIEGLRKEVMGVEFRLSNLLHSNQIEP